MHGVCIVQRERGIIRRNQKADIDNIDFVVLVVINKVFSDDIQRPQDTTNLKVRRNIQFTSTHTQEIDVLN